MSYAVAVVIQNLLGASMGPYIMGVISDRSDIGTAMSFLPIALVIASVLFLCGSFYYEKDLKKVEEVKLVGME
jgi:fucose permease